MLWAVVDGADDGIFIMVRAVRGPDHLLRGEINLVELQAALREPAVSVVLAGLVPVGACREDLDPVTLIVEVVDGLDGISYRHKISESSLVDEILE